MLYDNIFRKHHTPKKVEWSNNATAIKHITVFKLSVDLANNENNIPNLFPKFHPNPLRNETTQIATYIHTYIHTYILTYIHTYIHTHTLLTNQGKHPKDFGSLIRRVSVSSDKGDDNTHNSILYLRLKTTRLCTLWMAFQYTCSLHVRTLNDVMSGKRTATLTVHNLQVDGLARNAFVWYKINMDDRSSSRAW
jgi:hypothetical protein